jgi:diguanylate cyclase (GGDEF)-like protein
VADVLDKLSSILILEDDYVSSEKLRSLLVSGGVKVPVHEAKTVGQAVDIAYESNPSIALVDISVQGAVDTEDDVVSRLVSRLVTCRPQLPIVVVSSNELLEVTLLLGAQEVVHKDDVDKGLLPAMRRALYRKTADESIRYRASHDSLTGLLNRTHFIEAIERSIVRNRRYSTGCGVMYLDLDKFKPINDTYGHAAGDNVLKLIADRIKDELREGDVAARIGGDEMCVLVEDVRSRDKLASLARRLLDSVINPIAVENSMVTIGCSIGIAQVLNDEPSALDILKAADAAMFTAKRAGGNRLVFADDIPSKAEKNP